MILLLIVACGSGLAPGGSVKRGTAETGQDTGAPDDETGETGDSEETGHLEETGETGQTDSADSGDPGDSGDDTSEPDETAEPDEIEACYLGSDRGGDTCISVIDYDPAWGSDYDYPAPYGGSAQYAEPSRFIDLAVADPSLKLAPNFALDEVMSEAKGQYGLFQPHAIEALQEIRDITGAALTVNSAYRSPAYNAGVGGVSSSRHIYGDGVDIVSAGASLSELGDICYDVDADYVELYEAHVHCDWRDKPLDAAFYNTASSAKARLTSGPTPRPELHAVLQRSAGAWTAPATGFDEGEPLRQWTAWDGDGRPLLQATGRRFEAPAGTAAVSVVVGGRVRLRQQRDGTGSSGVRVLL